MSSLDTLPSDVVGEIVGHVRVDDPLYSPFANARAAGTCALVCRALAEPARREAFKMICLDDRRRVVALLALFAPAPHAAMLPPPVVATPPAQPRSLHNFDITTGIVPYSPSAGGNPKALLSRVSDIVGGDERVGGASIKCPPS